MPGLIRSLADCAEVKQKLASRALLGILALLAAASLMAGLRNANLDAGSVDFQYSAARLLLAGINPYELFPHDQSQFLLTQGPNYLPLLYFLLLPIGALDWPTARLIWSVINLAIGLFVAWRLGQGFGRARGSAMVGAMAALAFIASTPFRNTIGNGQAGLLVTAALILALQARSPLLKGALLALAVTKISLGAMFVALCGGLRMCRAVAMCGVLTLATFVMFGVMTHTQIGPGLFLGPVRAVQAGIRYSPPLDWLVDARGADAAILFNLTALAACFGGLLWFRRGQPRLAPVDPIPPHLIFAATLLALISAPHFIYDYVLLAVPFALGDPFKLLVRWARVLFAAILAFAAVGQKIAYSLLPADLADLLFVAMWLGLLLLALDCLRLRRRVLPG
jgi:Glycosyltransferase family 87